MLDNVSFGYHPKQLILRDINLRIENQGIIGLLGPNGAGKTTFVKLLVGLLSPCQGELRVLGSNPFKNATIRAQIGVMHQNPGFEDMLSGWDNLHISGKFFNLSFHEIRSRVQKIEEFLGPFDYFSQPMISLSGGQRRRLQVVRVLLNRPSLLILDEPTVGLDVHGRQRFYALIQNLRENQNLTILWTSHYLEEVERNCAHVLILSDGKIIKNET
jgi:ABC-2 type transport system ATP-binding protein